MKTWITVLTLTALLAAGGFTTLTSIARAQGAAEVAPAPDGMGSSPTLAPDPGDDLGGFISEAFDAVRSKNGWLIASTMVVLLSWGLRLGVRKRTSFLAWFATDRGGVLLTALVATLGGLAHATAAGSSPGWPFLLEVVEVWLGAVGMYVAGRRLLMPKDNVKFPKATGPQADFSLGGGKGGGYP